MNRCGPPRRERLGECSCCHYDTSLAFGVVPHGGCLIFDCCIPPSLPWVCTKGKAANPTVVRGLGGLFRNTPMNVSVNTDLLRGPEREKRFAAQPPVLGRKSGTTTMGEEHSRWNHLKDATVQSVQVYSDHCGNALNGGNPD